MSGTRRPIPGIDRHEMDPEAIVYVLDDNDVARPITSYIRKAVKVTIYIGANAGTEQSPVSYTLLELWTLAYPEDPFPSPAPQSATIPPLSPSKTRQELAAEYYPSVLFPTP